MVITIEDNVIRNCNKDPIKATKLLQLIPLFILKKHGLFIDMEQNDITLFKSPLFSSFYEYLQSYIRKIEKHNEEITKSTDYFVNIVLDKESVSSLKKVYEVKFPTAQINLFSDDERLVLKLDGKTLDIITTDLIEEYLCNPLKVVIEDIESDNLFITKCIEVYTGKNIKEMFIDFVNGSGSNTQKNLNYLSTKNYRVFCIIDGDEISPGEYVDETKPEKINEIVEYCENNGYENFVLSKREIENYLPDHILLKWKSKMNERYFELDEKQKDYFDIKYGIKHKDCKFSLWQSFSDGIESSNQNEIIIGGFGKKIWKAFNEVASSEDLKSRDSKSELETLVKKIMGIV